MPFTHINLYGRKGTIALRSAIIAVALAGPMPLSEASASKSVLLMLTGPARQMDDTKNSIAVRKFRIKDIESLIS
jgi:hypothetical protein